MNARRALGMIGSLLTTDQNDWLIEAVMARYGRTEAAMMCQELALGCLELAVETAPRHPEDGRDE